MLLEARGVRKAESALDCHPDQRRESAAREEDKISVGGRRIGDI